MEENTQYSPEYLAQDRSRVLINVIVAFFVLQSLFLALFLTSRFMNHTARGWDVYLMIPAYLFSAGNIITAILMVQHGGAGRHIAALDMNTVSMWLKLELADSFVYQFSICFPKLSILCFYRRVFSTKPYRYAIYAIGVLVILTCLAGLIGTLAICRPLAYFWDDTIVGGHCGDLVAACRYISIPNLVSDICILVLPLYGIWHLQMKSIHKVGLTLTFLAGCLGIVTGFLRLVAFITVDLFSDVTYNSIETTSWTVVEPAVYMIAATLPSLRPLIRYAAKDTRVEVWYNIFVSHCSYLLSFTQRSSSSSSSSHRKPLHVEKATYDSTITKETVITSENGPRTESTDEESLEHMPAWERPATAEGFGVQIFR